MFHEVLWISPGEMRAVQREQPAQPGDKPRYFAVIDRNIVAHPPLDPKEFRFYVKPCKMGTL